MVPLAPATTGVYEHEEGAQASAEATRVLSRCEAGRTEAMRGSRPLTELLFRDRGRT